MQHFSRWRNVLTLNNTIAQSARIGIPSTSPTTHLTSFHSTTAVLEKWKNEFNVDVGRDKLPSKSYVRYIVKQKRSDTKKALKGILDNGGCSALRPESFSKIEADFADQLNKRSRTKKTAARQAKRICQKKLKRKHRREDSYGDFEDTERRGYSYGDFEEMERVFRATYRKQGFYSTFRPEWTECFSWTNSGFNEQYCKSRKEYDKSYSIGTHADRRILDLPTTGPLKMEDVKTAFRSAALKWHPDKHQGPSQANAEEKFKQCMEAYKSLCNALSTV